MKNTIIIYTLTILLFTIAIGGLFSIKTNGSANYFADENRDVDKQYISEIKEVLSEYYMGNSGVTLTKTSQDGNHVEYTVEIHTGRTNSEEMIERVCAIEPDRENCSTHVVFSGKE